MSIFIIKIIACVTMVLDHVKYAVPQVTCFATQYLGRIAFPLFAFLLGEGYCHTSNLKKYVQRLVIFAVVSQIPFVLFRTLVGEWCMLNILVTLLFGLSTIVIWEKWDKPVAFFAIIGVVMMGQIVKVDYGWYGVLTVFILYVFRTRKKIRIGVFALLNATYYGIRGFFNGSIEGPILWIMTTLPVVLLLFYNGKLGRKTGYWYYVFYPVHMVILYGISFIVRG